MKGSLNLLKAVMVGFALLAGGRVLYENRDRIKRSWKNLGDLEGVQDLGSNLSVGKILGSVGQIRDIVNQFSRLK